MIGILQTATMQRTRILAVLLTDVVESTQLLTRLGEEVGKRQRVRHHGLLRVSLGHFGGTEVKNTGDGLLAVFESATDAARCAIEMQGAIEREGRRHPQEAAQIRIGLHVGEPVPEDGGFFGSTMVLVTRLCAAAEPGQILTSDLLRSILSSHPDLRFEAREPLNLKGFDRPLAVHEMIRDSEQESGCAWPIPSPVTSATTARSGFVGRAVETAEVLRWFRHHGRPRQTFGVVTGEPGVGKTRLLAEVALRVHHGGAVVLWGRCFDGDRSAGAPLLEALRDYLRWASAEGVMDADLAAAVRDLQHCWPTTPPLVPELVSASGLSGDAASRGPTVDLGDDSLRYFEALDLVLALLREDLPLLLVIDDLHWADEWTVGVLSHLVRAPDGDNVVTISSCCEEELRVGSPAATLLGALRRERRAEAVPLGGLTLDDVTALMRDGLDEDAPRDVVRTVFERSGGNPSVVEGLVFCPRGTATWSCMVGGGEPTGRSRSCATCLGTVSYATN